MVTDLEHVDRTEEPAICEPTFHRSLRVAGQQRDECPRAQESDDRAVVDVAVGQWPRHVGSGRVEDLERGGGVDLEALAGPAQHQAEAGLAARIGQEAGVGRVVERNPGMDQHPDPEARHYLDQARDVVLVRMREEHHVDPALEERQVRAEAAKGEVRVGATVDEHGAPGRGLDQDRVTLADVERGQMQPSVGQTGQADRAQQRHAGEDDPLRAQDPPDQVDRDTRRSLRRSGREARSSGLVAPGG